MVHSAIDAQRLITCDMTCSSLCQGVQAPVSRHLFHDRDLGTGHVDPDYLDQARAIAGHA